MADATLVIKIVTDTAKAKFGDVTADAGKFRSTMSRMVAPAAAAALAVGALGVAAVNSASRAQQAMGAVDSVFGKSATKIHAWAATAADSVGLAASEYEELASVIGAQLKNMGVPMDKVAGKTKTLVALGADLAATYGGTTAEAVGALSSALRGETDPIERYGVSVKQADIAARQAAEGTDKLTGAAAKQAKTAALLTLVTQQTADAHGQFARESDTAAVSQQKTAAKVENLKAKLGTALLPVVAAVTTAFGVFADWAAAHQTTFQVLIAVIGALAVAVLAINVALAVTAVVASPVALIVLAIVAAVVLLAAAFVLAYKKSTVFRNIVNAVWNGIKATVKGVVSAVTAAWSSISLRAGQAITGIGKAWNTVTGAIGSAVRTMSTAVTTAWNAVKTAVLAVIRVIGSTATGAWTAIRNAATTAWNGVKDAIARALTAAATLLRELPGKVRSAFSGAASWLVSAGRDVISGLISGINAMVGGLIAKAKDIAGKVTSAFKGALKIGSPSKVFSSIGRDVMAGLRQGMDDGVAGVLSVVDQATAAIVAAFTDRFKNEKKAAKLSRAAIKSLSDETEALKANAQERQLVARKLESAQGDLEAAKSAFDSFAASVTQSAKQFGSVTSAEGGTAAELLTDMAARVQKVVEFKRVLASLAAQGLSASTIADLAAKGVEGGLEQAQMIAAAGPDMVAQMNALQGQLNSAATGLGQKTAQTVYGEGVTVAQALVDGLLAQQATLEAQAIALGEALAKAITDAMAKALAKPPKPKGGKKSVASLSVPNVASFAAPSVARTGGRAATSSGGGGTVINIHGAVDPEAVARQINRIQTGHTRRVGLRA